MIKRDRLDPPRIKWLLEPTFDEDGVQKTAGLDEKGSEVGDPVPVQPPVGLNVSQGDELHKALRTLLIKERATFQAMVEAEEFETEEEANDFVVSEDLFPPGNEPWEDIFEFPVQEPGSSTNGPTLASGAVKGEPPAQTSAPPVGSSQRSSVDSRVVSPSSAMKEQRPKGVDDVLPGEASSGSADK